MIKDIIMHIRIRPWAEPELKECEYFIDAADAQALKNRWADAFTEKKEMHLELGCGKCVSTGAMAHAHPEINYIGIDIVKMILAQARRFVAAEYGEDPVSNLLLVRHDITLIDRVFGEKDRFKRIYINFCNPWDKRRRYHKRRLTHPLQLERYKNIMDNDAEIWFKTDSETLWADSLGYFGECGFEIRYMTEDLHREYDGENFMTEHEKRFTEEGIPIRFLKAAKK